jgi:hypothetical protein
VNVVLGHLTSSFFFQDPYSDTTAKANSKYCHFRYSNARNNSIVSSKAKRDKKEFLKDGISLVALSYKAPMTLLNSMKTWKVSGLLDVVSEKILIVNDPTPEEYAIGLEFGFRVVEPKTIRNAKVLTINFCCLVFILLKLCLIL